MEYRTDYPLTGVLLSLILGNMEEEIPTTVEEGQYWRFDMPQSEYSLPSVWKIAGISEDDRGEGLWASLVLVSMATAGQSGYKHIGDREHIPVESLVAKFGWYHIEEADLPLVILGDL